MASRYDVINYRGVRMDRWAAQLFDKLFAKFPGLIMTQGVKSGAVASGGTHLGLGVGDIYLGPHKWKDVLKYAFEIGFFGWYRPELWIGGKRIWKSHMHLGVRGHSKMAASLKAQQVSWTKRRNGLKGDGPDAYTWRPSNYKSKAPYTTARKIYFWHTVAFLNVWGDDGGTGTRTFTKRLPKMVKDITNGEPSVIGFCEVRTEQIEPLRAAMAAAGYKPAGYERRIAVFVLPDIEIGKVSFYTYSEQNKGAIEGILRLHLKVWGHWNLYGFTHLDYRPGYDNGRVRQMKQGAKAMTRTGLSVRLIAKDRQVIGGDFNSRNWVMDKALNPAGFRDMGCGADIDFLTTGSKRAILSADKVTTDSDHPIIRAVLGKVTPN